MNESVLAKIGVGELDAVLSASNADGTMSAASCEALIAASDQVGKLLADRVTHDAALRCICALLNKYAQTPVGFYAIYENQSHIDEKIVSAETRELLERIGVINPKSK